MKTKNVIAAICLTMALMGCKKEKGSIQTNDDETLVLETGSKATWRGYLETGYFNQGTIGLKGEELTIEGDKITGGEIQISVGSILVTNEGMPEENKNELREHLQTVDFFNLAKYPFVTYKIDAAEKTGKIDAEGNNYLIKGSLNLIGKSLPLDIPAKINITETDVKVISKFKFDRTKWGMAFASQPNLPAKDKIKNDIEVELELKAIRF
ncbi:YceI family protein [Sphingobacterium sp. 18053]|uniref:YceI family protein n=1 Tax=Sphingobacterium sp. 18053 TaxID=2681401 RepID=UPI00135BF25B|nr:YceI family protein [Sphingobacterium sp. 18053]